MKIETVGQPASTQAQDQSPRAKAIAAFNKAAAQSQEHPVANPSQVSPEELSAVQAPSGQDNAVEEAPNAPEVPAAKDKELLSTQYAQLARREKAIYAKAQARERAIAEREAAVQAKEEALKAKDSEYQSGYIPKSKLAEDPVTTLLENGLTYDQITQMFMQQSTQDPATKVAIQRLEQQLRAQEEAREADRKAYAQSQDAQYKQALNQIRTDAKALVQSDPNSYEAIRKTGSIRDVVDLIEQTFKQDGTILSVEEACREVEDHLVEKLSQYSQISKIQQRMKANQSSPKQQASNTQQREPKPTLTNSVGTSKKLSAKERAILAFKGELKQ